MFSRTKRYALRDDQWERIQEFLPGRVGHVGGTAKDNQRFRDFGRPTAWRCAPLEHRATSE